MCPATNEDTAGQDDTLVLSGGIADVRLVHGALCNLRRKGPSFPEDGICSNLRAELLQLASPSRVQQLRPIQWVVKWSRHWPHHSGLSAWPVSADNIVSPADWRKDTTEGKLRWDLLNFLIEVSDV